VIPLPQRILIVEDDDASRQGLQQLLANAGYIVLAASTFAEGRRAAAEDSPDLLIADIRLGEFNGLHLLAAAPRAVPTIIVSGFHDPVLEAEARRLGAQYLSKPIEPVTLLGLIEEALLSATERTAASSTRRWDRKAVGGQVVARVDGELARLVDICVGGLRFEIEREQPLPTSFTVKIEAPELSLDAHLVWETRRGDRHRLCGAALSWSNALALHHWVALVDGFAEPGTGAF
jgi:CheY-like chemotaxis protein